jgi:hypothetical protein
MPKRLERKLAATARKRGYSAARTRRYVYGGLRRAGWKPGRK